MKVNIFEAKNRLSELVQRAAAGEEVIIANRGKPVVKLVKAEETVSERDREEENRRLDALVAEMHRIPDRPDAYDPFDWDEVGLDK